MVFGSVSAIHRKIPTFIEIIAFVTINGFFVCRDRRCGARAGILGRRVRARAAAGGVPLERGSGGGTEGGGKLTCLVWQFLGIAAM
jgi:hypothetical protein